MFELDFIEKWGWEGYQNTPQYIIDRIIGKNEIDNKLNKIQ